MNIQVLLKDKRREILSLAEKHGASNVRVFGSVARGDNDERSDIDFLVQMAPDRSLMDHAALLVDLEALLGRHVDVAPENVLRPAIRERILREAMAI